jgi:diguanylate cyclase (GGDEF)-like protein/PAS domain S-box-containing protein
MGENHKIFQGDLHLLDRCVVVVDKDLNIVGSSQQDLKAIRDNLETSSPSCCDYFCPDQPLSCQPCIVREVFERGQPFKIEKTPGQSGPVEIGAFPIFDSAGEVAFVAKQTSPWRTQNSERQPGENEERFREMADCLPQTVFEADPLGRITFTNKFSFEQFGYTRDDFEAGINMFQVVAPQDRAKALNLAQRVLRGEKEVSGEIEALRSNGSTFPGLVYGSPIVKEGGVTGLRGMLMDITKQKRAEQSLQKSEKRYRALVENQVELVIRWLPDTTLTYVNPAFCRFFDKTEKELLGRKFLTLLPEIFHKKIETQIELILQELQPVYSEFQSVASDGSPTWHRWSDTPILDDKGRVVEIQSVGMDITRLKDTFRMLHQSELRFQHLAQHDPLTGLPNRRLLMDRLNHAIAKSRRFRRPLAVFVVDVDKFRKINDSLGYEIGGKVLREIAERLGEVAREADTLAKLDSDEFVIVCEEIKSRDNAALLAKQIVDLLSIPLTVSGYILYLSVSVGIALLDDNPFDAGSLLRAADIAMNEAQKRGGKRYMFFSRDMEDHAREVFWVEEQLRQALEKKDLHLVYQPQIDLTTGQTVGVEALVRLGKTSDAGMSPAKFIPVAENSGLIFPLGDWVLEKACAQNRIWLESGLSPLTVTVNLSPKQFSQPDFVEKVIATLKKTGLPPRWLELEITESALMEDISHAIVVMKKLQNLGVSFTIDDFGKGFSSLTHLRYLPLSKLKIDRSFVKNVPEKILDVKLVHSVLALARTFDLKTVVEGIETRRQLEFFKELKCDMAQGFFVGRPVFPEEIPSCFERIF